MAYVCAEQALDEPALIAAGDFFNIQCRIICLIRLEVGRCIVIIVVQNAFISISMFLGAFYTLAQSEHANVLDSMILFEYEQKGHHNLGVFIAHFGESGGTARFHA